MPYLGTYSCVARPIGRHDATFPPAFHQAHVGDDVETQATDVGPARAAPTTLVCRVWAM